MVYSELNEKGRQCFLTGEHSFDLLVQYNLHDAIGLYKALIVTHCNYTGEVESIYGIGQYKPGKIPSKNTPIFRLYDILPVAGK